jgi:hypothetical protein
MKSSTFTMLKKIPPKIKRLFTVPSRIRDYALLVFAVIFGIISALVLRMPSIIEKNILWPWVMLILCGLLGGFSLLRMNAWLADGSGFPQEPIAADLKRLRQARTCLFVAGILSIWVVLNLWEDTADWGGVFLPWLLSLILLLTAGFLLQPLRQNQPKEGGLPRKSQFDFPIPRWLEIALFVFILGLAVFLRVYQLDSIPTGIYVDETNGAIDALGILDGNHASPFKTGWYGTPNGYIYFMAGMLKLFGVNYFTLKAISVIPAILTVAAIFPLGRMMFGPLGGLSAMLLLAVSRWHLSLSRWGWNELTVPLFQILATYFLLRGLRERRLKDFILGGVLSGLMMYTYLSNRLAIVTLALFCVYWLLIDPAGLRNSIKRLAPGLALFALAFAITFAPLAVTYATDPFSFSNRVNEVSVFRNTKEAGSLQPLWDNIVDHLRFFHQVGDYNGRHNLPAEPETDPFLGALFVIGLSYGLMKLRDRRFGLLWLWLLLALCGGIFSSNAESPQSYRTLTALPALALLAGDVVSKLLRGGLRVVSNLADRPGGMKKSFPFKILASAAFGLCLLGSSVWNTTLFFGKQAHSLAYESGFNLTENGIAREVIAALKIKTPVYLTPSIYEFSQVRYLAYGYGEKINPKNSLDERPYFLIHPEDTLPIPALGSDVILVLDVNYEPLMNLLLDYYPNAQISYGMWRNETPLYIKVWIPKSDFEAIQGLSYSATLNDGSARSGNLPSLTLPEDTSEISSIEWYGGIQIEHSGEYQFLFSKDLQLFMDGELWTESRALCNGLHQIRVLRNSPASQAGLELKWVLPDGKEEAVPDRNLFRTGSLEHGLTGYYYHGTEWQGDLLCVMNTPFFMLGWPDEEPITGAFSASFKGYLRVSQAGTYTLLVDADDGARLTLDGVVVGQGLVAGRPNYFEVTLELQAGDHPIQLDYFQSGGGNALNFYWTPPGGQRSIVPIDALIPQESP